MKLNITSYKGNILFFAFLSLIFVSCKNNTQNEKPSPHVDKVISITSVTLDGKSCEKGALVEVESSNAKLVITFAVSYKDLSVEVNDSGVGVKGNVAILQFTDLNETEKFINIVAKAKDREQAIFSFRAKKEKTVIPPSGNEKKFTVGDVSFIMKKIPKAENVTIGDDSQDCVGNGYCNKRHNVSITEFYMAETETTQKLYQAIMEKNPSRWKKAATGETFEEQPVESISWTQGVAFCNELTIKVLGNEESCVYYIDETLKTPFRKNHTLTHRTAYADMAKNGFRLPTEAEWEWAARGGNNNKWAGTDKETELKDYAWYVGSATGAESRPHQVKLKKPNALGLYDMSGNVWEFCHDFYETIQGGDLGLDPTGPKTGNKGHTMRGGWTGNGATSVTVSIRFPLSIPALLDIAGFRIAARLKD